jgi:hypothetical protein
VTTDEIIRALSGFESGTLAVIRFRTADGGYFELPVAAVEYMPAKYGEDAYLAIKPHQFINTNATAIAGSAV